MLISIIVAMGQNRVIGANGGLPWHISGDLKRVKALTLGKPIIMGRKNYESIGRPLPGRHNIVLSRNRDLAIDGVTVVHDLEAAFAAAGDVPEVVIFGGEQIYRDSLSAVERIYMTEVSASPAGDTYFPELESGSWHETARESHQAEGQSPAYSFVTLERRH